MHTMDSMKFLVFNLYGTTASWGEVAVGEQRPTRTHPTKSSIVGLLAAALGYDRSDEARHLQLAQSLLTGVCVHADGEPMRDYHTAQVPETPKNTPYKTRYEEIRQAPSNKIRTILSQRDYQCGGVYQVAVWNTAPASQTAKNQPFVKLEQMAEALKQPCFTLYLGRKSCPLALPVQPQIIAALNLKQAFDVAHQQSHIQEFLSCVLNCTQYRGGVQDNSSRKISQLPASKPRGHTIDQRARSLEGKPSTQLALKYYWDQAADKKHIGIQEIHQHTVRDHVHSRSKWQFTNRTECYGSRVSTKPKESL